MPCPRLPNFQSPWMKHCGVARTAVDKGSASARSASIRSRRRRRDAGGEALPPLDGDLRHPLGVAEHRLAGELARTEPLPAQPVRQQAELVVPPPRGGAQRGEGVEQGDVLGLGHGVVADRHELARHVPHQQGDAPPVATPRCGAEGGVVDRRRGDVHQPGLPRPSRPATDVAGHPHREVVVGMHVLDHAPLPVDERPARTASSTSSRRAGTAGGGRRPAARPPRRPAAGRRARRSAPAGPLTAQSWRSL